MDPMLRMMRLLPSCATINQVLSVMQSEPVGKTKDAHSMVYLRYDLLYTSLPTLT